MADSAEDRRRSGDQSRLANAFGAVGAERLFLLDNQHFDFGHVADCWNQIIVQIVAPPRHIFFHQREAEPLGDAALHLAFHLNRIDGAPDIMRGGDFQHLGGAQFHIHFDRGDLGGEAIRGVGRALTVLIQWDRRRVERAIPFEDGPIAASGKSGKVNLMTLSAIAHGDDMAGQLDCGIGAGIRVAQYVLAQILAGQLRRLAGHESLARRRSFTGICCQVGIADNLLHLCHW